MPAQRMREFLGDREIFKYPHWPSRLGIVHDPKSVPGPSNRDIQEFQLQTRDNMSMEEMLEA